MSYTADDTSLTLGEPIELYEFLGPAGQLFTYTSYHEDVVFDARTYTSIPISRTELAGSGNEDAPTVDVELPVTIDVVQRYAFGPPPTLLFLTIRRYHPTGGPGSAIIYWRGDATAVTVTRGGRTARFRVPNIIDNALRLEVPSVYYQSTCNHVLYDGRCRVVRSQYQVNPNPTVVSLADGGITVTVSGVDGIPALAANLPPTTPVDYLNTGEMVRVIDGERRLIVDNQFTILTINRPFSTLNVGDELQLFAGCDHSINTCNEKFGNTLRFGGHPTIPRLDVYRNSRGPF